MVALTSTPCLDDLETNPIAISHDDLRSLFKQVEAELYRSETYQKALAHLQETAEKAIDGSQLLIRAVGREAIRLALRRFAKQYQVMAVTPVPSAASQPVQESEVCVLSSEITPQAPLSPKWQSPTNEPKHTTPQPKRSGRTVTSPLAQQRESLLKEIGQSLQHARQNQRLSLEQLYTRTWIPIHQLKLLEAGDADRLPEDIYICGFIRRIGEVLKIDGMAMADSLMSLNPSRSVIPSWQRSSRSAGYIGPAHLYFGYAALLAGAFGGLAWMSQQNAPQLFNQNLPSPSPSPQATRSEARTTAQQATPNLTPPETLPVR